MAESPSFTQLQQSAVEEWKKFVTAQVASFESVLSEVAKLESKAASQIAGGFDEAGRYAREGLAFAARARALRESRSATGRVGRVR